ncbi:MAG: VOC family protein [Beutenbergiaceae bacterium]
MALIDHIGVLVPDLEEGIERWSRATGYDFSPVARYRTHHYIDHTQPGEHFHDARISFSKQGPPRIELMEVTGSGTHGPAEVGIHHLGIVNVADPERMLADLDSKGIGHDGRSLSDEGLIHLFFTEKKALDGVRLEFVSTLVSPVVADDGSPLWRDPNTGKASFWGPPEPTS